jgi:hypothetical protein
MIQLVLKLTSVIKYTSLVLFAVSHNSALYCAHLFTVQRAAVKFRFTSDSINHRSQFLRVDTDYYYNQCAVLPQDNLDNRLMASS